MKNSTIANRRLARFSAAGATQKTSPSAVPLQASVQRQCQN